MFLNEREIHNLAQALKNASIRNNGMVVCVFTSCQPVWDALRQHRRDIESAIEKAELPEGWRLTIDKDGLFFFLHRCQWEGKHPPHWADRVSIPFEEAVQ